MNVSDLEKRLKVEHLPVYFLKGEDVYLRETALKIFKSLVDADYADFNLETYETVDTIKEIVASLNTAPVFSDLRLVIVKSTYKIDDGEKSLLLEYLKNPAEFSMLVLIDDNDKDVFASMFKYGDVVDCNRSNEMQVTNYVIADARARGYIIEPQAVKLLAQFTNCNMTRVMVELQKLYSYCEGRISAVDVEEMVTPDIEYATFKLSNALAEGKNSEALKVLNSLLEKGNKPTSLLNMLIKQYRRMLEAKISTLEPDALATALGVKPFAVMSAKGLAAKYTPVELKAFVDKLHKLEYEIKSGITDEQDALGTAVAMLLKKSK